ncbi:MAG: glutathione S-transferase family protein [Candidatus Omnitrophica bacterium]|nr:glutathione S-transferase family protein [Candidatus Omnitrophota bacterium]
MLNIYGSDLSSPANKVRYVANYLKIPYEYRRVNLREGEHRKPEFLKLHPASKIPVMDDNGFVLFESGAMIKYLAAKEKSALYPADDKERALVDQWLDFVSFHIGDGMARVAYNRLFAPRMGAEVDEKSIQAGLQFLNRFLPVVENQLSRDKYLVGDVLTLADFTLLAVLDPAELAQIDLSSYQNISRWRNTLRQQEFYTRCHKEYGEALMAGKKA